MSVRRFTCRSCGAASLELIHDFGSQPLAGEFLNDADRSRQCKRYPLDLQRCADCGLVQIVELPPIEEVFHEDYKYATGTIPSLVKHFEDYAGYLDGVVPPRSQILEFGCNDGTLLSMIKARGHRVLGVDPSRNVARVAADRGLEVVHAFFTPDLVLTHGLTSRFDLVTCSNVFAHIDSLNEATRAAWLALKPGGRFCVEVHDAEKLFSQSQFDTVYHEHLTYFSIATLERHLARSGFSLIAHERTPMHGGGLRVLAQKASAAPNVGACDAEDPSQRQSFAAAIERCRQDVLNVKRQHGSLWGYGAAGRSQMFINVTRTQELFEQIFDDSALRQNKYIIGSGIPIRPFDGERRAGACVVLAWNYADAISRRIAGCFDAVYVVLPRLQRLA